MQLDLNLDEADWRDAVSRRVNDHLQFQWVKVQVGWEDLQPNGPTDYGETFQRVEQYLQFANAEGLNILISVARAPGWARSNQAEDGPPDDPQALANFLTLLVGKVPFVDAVEVWNEPNLQREWQGTMPFNGAGYMRLFAPAYQAIKGVNGGIRVVTAGLAPTGNNPGSRDDRQYLREMYANGLAQYTDIAVGVHPYSWGNSPDASCCGTRGWDDDPHFFFGDTMREYREILNANGQSANELWPTEFGWATWDGFPGDPPEPWMAFNDRWAQANYTIRAFEIGQADPTIGPMFLWNLNFAILGNLVEEGDERAAYSLLVPLQPAERPLYWMLYDAVRPDEELDRYD
jgi:polysaccharide biosynthesis protein PslG